MIGADWCWRLPSIGPIGRLVPEKKESIPLKWWDALLYPDEWETVFRSVTRFSVFRRRRRDHTL